MLVRIFQSSNSRMNKEKKGKAVLSFNMLGSNYSSF